MIRRSNTVAQAFIEYGLILGLLMATVILSLTAMGVSTRDVYCTIAKSLAGNPVSCAHYFVDDFSNLSAWTIVNGNWRNENGQLCGGGREGRIFVPLSERNYAINVRMALLQQGNGYGIYFRATNFDRVDGYTFQYDPGYYPGAFLFRKWVRGNELSPFARANAPGYNWHNVSRQIRIEVNGNTFTAYVDGQKVLTGSDSTYTYGGVGFRTWDATQACFDDLSIDPLP
ncbi:MAG: family 16 glycoside hydrolase [Anaerolineae bacterium]